MGTIGRMNPSLFDQPTPNVTHHRRRPHWLSSKRVRQKFRELRSFLRESGMEERMVQGEFPFSARGRAG